MRPGMMASIVTTVVIAVPASALDQCWLEQVQTPIAYAWADMADGMTETSSARMQVLICRGGSYGESNASRPPDSGEYLDVAQGRVMEYDAASETMSDAGAPLPPEHDEDQTGQCRYAAGEWSSDGTYTYGRCWSLRVGADLTFRFRLSAREVNGTVLTGIVQFRFLRADHSPAGPDKEVQGVTCPTVTRAGVSIANCDHLPDTGTLPRTDIPPDAAYYCGIGRLYKTVGGQRSEAEDPIFAPCQDVPAVPAP